MSAPRSNAATFALRLRGGPTPPPGTGGAQAAAPAPTAPRSPAAIVDRLGQVLASRARLVHRPTGALVLVRGGAPLVELVSAALAKHVAHVPAIVVATGPVVTDVGDIEAAPALAGLFFGGIRASIAQAADVSEAGRFADGKPAFVLASAGLASDLGAPVRGLGGGSMGASFVGDRLSIVVDGIPTTAPVAALRFEGLSPILEHGSGCKLLGPSLTVTATRGERVLSLDERPALEALGEHASGSTGVVVLARGEGDDPDALELVPIKGVDPSAGAFLAQGTFRVGDTVRFASARSDVSAEAFDRITSRAARRSNGAAPRFALYVGGGPSAASPSSDLESPARVVVRRRFGAMPLLGFRSETPLFFDERGAVIPRRMGHVLALFRQPS